MDIIEQAKQRLEEWELKKREKIAEQFEERWSLERLEVIDYKDIMTQAETILQSFLLHHSKEYIYFSLEDMAYLSEKNRNIIFRHYEKLCRDISFKTEYFKGIYKENCFLEGSSIKAIFQKDSIDISLEEAEKNI